MDYSQDYTAWIAAQATLLKERRFDALDLENLVDEFESLRWQEIHRFKQNLKRLMYWRLRWEFDPAGRCGQWRKKIYCRRCTLTEILAASPSLRPVVENDPKVLDLAYQSAVIQAARKVEQCLHELPQRSPWSLENLLTFDP